MTASARYVTEIPDCCVAIYKNTILQRQVYKCSRFASLSDCVSYDVSVSK